MEKGYVLKTGGFYLSKYYLNEENYETDFIDSILFTSKIDRALVLNEAQAIRLSRILYVESGIDFTLKEI